MRILYKLTTRSRPAKMFAAIENIRAMAVEKDPTILVTLDKSDGPSNSPQVKKQLEEIPNLTAVYGYSKNKIHAFNRDVPKEGWDIIVASSDDIQFLKGFDEQIKTDAMIAAITLNDKNFNLLWTKEKILPGGKSMYISDMDFTIWYGDGAVHDKIMTVPIMTKKYYDRLGYIYNPIYSNLFCDEEAVYVGENLKKIYYSTAEIMVHNHPAWGKGVWDSQYRRTDASYHTEKKIFDKRKALNFPI